MSIEEQWIKPFEVDGEHFEAVFVRRAFREGLEVTVDYYGEEIHVAELGFGEMALLEQVKSIILQKKSR